MVKTGIFPVTQGIDYLGYKIWPHYRLLRKRSTKRIRRALKHFQKLHKEGKIDFARIRATVQSWLGHAKHADSYHFRKKLFKEITFISEKQ